MENVQDSQNGTESTQKSENKVIHGIMKHDYRVRKTASDGCRSVIDGLDTCELSESKKSCVEGDNCDLFDISSSMISDSYDKEFDAKNQDPMSLNRALAISTNKWDIKLNENGQNTTRKMTLLKQRKLSLIVKLDDMTKKHTFPFDHVSLHDLKEKVFQIDQEILHLTENSNKEISLLNKQRYGEQAAITLSGKYYEEQFDSAAEADELEEHLMNGKTSEQNSRSNLHKTVSRMNSKAGHRLLTNVADFRIRTKNLINLKRLKKIEDHMNEINNSNLDGSCEYGKEKSDVHLVELSDPHDFIVAASKSINHPQKLEEENVENGAAFTPPHYEQNLLPSYVRDHGNRHKNLIFMSDSGRYSLPSLDLCHKDVDMLSSLSLTKKGVHESKSQTLESSETAANKAHNLWKLHSETKNLQHCYYSSSITDISRLHENNRANNHLKFPGGSVARLSNRFISTQKKNLLDAISSTFSSVKKSKTFNVVNVNQALQNAQVIEDDGESNGPRRRSSFKLRKNKHRSISHSLSNWANLLSRSGSETTISTNSSSRKSSDSSNCSTSSARQYFKYHETSRKQLSNSLHSLQSAIPDKTIRDIMAFEKFASDFMQAKQHTKTETRDSEVRI